MMDTSARLISVTYTGSLGTMVRTETETPIFCRMGSVDRAEYYSAFDSRLKPKYKVTTHPVNYNGQSIIELDTPDEGAVRCDIYRTYRVSNDEMELWLTEKNDDAVQTFTLWTGGKRVTLFGAYLTGSNGTDRTDTGQVATDEVHLILPQTFQAFCGTTPVSYSKPKAYASMTDAEQDTHFYIDTSCFFAVGDIAATGKYQAINSAYDDVYLVRSVYLRNEKKPDTEYLEVVGK